MIRKILEISAHLYLITFLILTTFISKDYLVYTYIGVVLLIIYELYNEGEKLSKYKKSIFSIAMIVLTVLIFIEFSN